MLNVWPSRNMYGSSVELFPDINQFYMELVVKEMLTDHLTVIFTALWNLVKDFSSVGENR